MRAQRGADNPSGILVFGDLGAGGPLKLSATNPHAMQDSAELPQPHPIAHIMLASLAIRIPRP